MEAKEEKKSGGFALITGWVLVLFGWSFSVLIANGSELQRLAWILPFVSLGSLFCVIGGKTPSKGCVILVSMAVGYFLWRASTSPVWDEARRDVALVSMACLGVVSAAFSLHSRLCRSLLIATSVLLLGGHLLIGGYQYFGHLDFKVFRPRLEDERFISGLVFNRNYLTGILEISTPILVALVFLSQGGKRFGYALAVFLSVVLAFFSFSRGGFGAVGIGCVTTTGVLLWSRWKEKGKTVKVTVLRLLAGGALFVVLGCALALLWFKVLDARYAETDSGIMGELKGRLVLSGVAFEIWQNSPLFGSGAQSFGFLFTKYYSSDLHGGFLGYARMVHNEYAQVLTEYGVVGFSFLVVLIVYFGWLALCRIRQCPEDWRGPAFAGALTAELVRSTIDFNLHLAPSLLIFAILAGGVVSLRECSSSRALSMVVVLAVSVFGLFSFQGELKGGVHYARYEMARIRGEEEQLKSERDTFVAIAPEFRMLRLKARDSMRNAVDHPGDRAKARVAQENWEKVVERHPFDGESLANLARSLDEQGKFDEAEAYHLRAIKAAGNRERKYGVFYGYGRHLIYRAALLRKQRKPGQVLFLLREARDIVGYTRSQRYENREMTLKRRRWLESEISFLEGARIEAIPIPVLDWRQFAK